MWYIQPRPPLPIKQCFHRPGNSLGNRNSMHLQNWEYILQQMIRIISAKNLFWSSWKGALSSQVVILVVLTFCSFTLASLFLMTVPGVQLNFFHHFDCLWTHLNLENILCIAMIMQWCWGDKWHNLGLEDPESMSCSLSSLVSTSVGWLSMASLSCIPGSPLVGMNSPLSSSTPCWLYEAHHSHKITLF